mmetsp:Transcript_1992/g.4201  ORF Transcript_1992/g.4201 Transcript_1992/m.4201 type:complete len:681 (-) Transcript_1992:154-2196(-)
MDAAAPATPPLSDDLGKGKIRRSTRPRGRDDIPLVLLSDRRFDVGTLPKDMQRVYRQLAEKHGDEYGLLFVFTMRTAVELHRAWNMTLLTSNVLQQIKDEFDLHMTWDLGVFRLKFRVDDGAHELHRKVPYDYDSEYQDIYYRIAIALIRGDISVDEALLYQTEAKHGIHTAGSGLFLRDFPGRLVVYPLQASMCAIIFFNGGWIDAAIAAICGLVAGFVEYTLSYVGGQAKMLIDVTVGLTTGIIGGLWYKFQGQGCLSAIFLGTLYWFFYGTAFVIGLLEIIAGELETGVTRFVAVSVKTFVLSLGASLGLMLAVKGGASIAWHESTELYCGGIVNGQWYRIPVYLLCSVGVLGQFRLQISRYWVGLLVQLAAYEIQYQTNNGLQETFLIDHLDTATSNIAGATVGVLVACALSWVGNKFRKIYAARLLQKDQTKDSCFRNLVYSFMRYSVKVHSAIRINRRSEIQKLQLEEKLKRQHEELNDPSSSRSRIEVEGEDEDLYLETVVGSQDINIWSILMPAVYQLVPGSVIAKFWFAAIFPPVQDGTENSEQKPDGTQDSVFSNLMGKKQFIFQNIIFFLQSMLITSHTTIARNNLPMSNKVISASLSLGLIFGFALVQDFIYARRHLLGSCCEEDPEKALDGKRRQTTISGMYTSVGSPDDDPPSIRHESVKNGNKDE